MPNLQKILFVEDNPEFRQMFTALLTASGFEVQQATDGIEGLSIAQIEGGFDLILADLKMPKMDGLECINELKTKPTAKPNGPIVAFTSVTQEYIKDEAIRRGAIQVITKDESPPEQIVEKIKTIIKNHPLPT